MRYIEVRYVTVRFIEWHQYINKKINNFASSWAGDDLKQHQLVAMDDWFGVIFIELRHKWWRHKEWRNYYYKCSNSDVFNGCIRDTFKGTFSKI